MKHRSIFAVAITALALFSVAALAAKSQKTEKIRSQSSVIQMQQVSPADTNLDLPPGPRTGQFFLTGATNGFSNGVHDLGLIKKGQKLTMFVEGLSTGFDPIVIVIAPNWAQNNVIIWQADDNGSDPDPAFSITAPISGNYTMLVAEYSQRSGWYRFRMEIN